MLEITTKMEINSSPEAVYEAFVDPGKIGNFWFSKSSERWSAGKTITLEYSEFSVQRQIEIIQLVPNQKIRLTWGPKSDERAVSIYISPRGEGTVVAIKEVGFQEYESLLSDPTLSEIRTFEYEDILNNLMNGKAAWTFVLTCLKAYLENGLSNLRTGFLG